MAKTSRKVASHLTEGIDLDGFATFRSTLSASRRTFCLELESSVPMEWDEVLLALAQWLSDEAKKLSTD